MALRKCPICGASVKLENLERHVNSVHPSRRQSINLSKEELRTIRTERRTRTQRPLVKRSTIIIAVTTVLLVVGIVVAWPYIPRSGVRSGMALHIHPHLVITINGQQVTVPSQIGIDPSLWVDHSLDQYGMQGMAPLHTHDASGTIHVESRDLKDYTIGEFFAIWGQTFDGQEVLGHQAQVGHTVWMVLDGQRMAPTDSLVLRDNMQVQIVCGPA